MKSAEELFKYRMGLEKTVPQRGGTKDYMPDGSWLQGKRLQKFHEEREAVMMEPRVQRIVDLVKGEWQPDKQLVELEKEMRNFWEHMGFVDNKRKWLFAEEALFLMETNVLEVWYRGIPLSIQQAYAMFLGEKFPLEFYQVYSHLRRIGYVVLRHQQRSFPTKYERQIRLDKYISKKDRKRALKAEKEKLKNPENESHSPAKKLDLGLSEDIEYEQAAVGVKRDANMETENETFDGETNGGNVASEQRNVEVDEEHEEADVSDIAYEIQAGGWQDQSRGNCMESRARGNSDENCMESRGSENSDDNRMESRARENSDDNCMECSPGSGHDKQDTELEKSDFEQEFLTEQNFGQDDHCFVSENQDKKHEHQRTENRGTNVSDTEKVTCQEGIVHDGNSNTKPSGIDREEIPQSLSHTFSQLSVWNIQGSNKSAKLNTTDWNFDEIAFPDFGTCGDVTVEIRRPEGRLLPGNFYLACENYYFNKKEMVNKKKSRYFNEDLNWNDDSLEFSYPEIMTGQANVKRACKNWSEYKNCQYRASESWDRSHELSHLYGDEVQPLVLPENASSTGAVLDKLQVIQDEELIQDSNSLKDRLRETPAFDIYAPNIKFKKSAPGIPEHSVCVAKCSDPFPNLLQVARMIKTLGNDVPLLWAVVDSGDIAFYEINELLLPVDITMG